IAGMGIRFFRGQKTKFEHEHHQLKEIARIVAKEFPDETVYLLTNVLVANGELDCVVLTSHGPLILDLKAFSGTIHGSENGKWQVETKDGVHALPNLFIQSKIHRQDFIDKMIMICRAHFPHIGEINLKKIGSWAYFCKGSDYPAGQIDFRRVKWFRVVTAESLPEKLRFIDSGYTLRPEDMDAIVRDLHLQEYSFSTDKEIRRPETGRPKGLFGTPRRKILLAAVIVIALVLIIPGMNLLITDSATEAVNTGGALFQSVSKDTLKSASRPSDSSDALAYLNQFREQNEKKPLYFDERLYNLSIVRARDMQQYEYLAYVNPRTGTCANSLKTLYGLSTDENVVESAYGQWNGYTRGIERVAIDSWMKEPGNQKQLLGNYSSGAVSCSGGYCTFLGLNNDRTGTECQTGPSGMNMTS
ncbi:MAG: NERD domain-containing protein, partial [Methanomicrobiales archaeon]